MKKFIFAALLVAMPLMAQESTEQEARGPRGERPTAEQRQEMLQNAMEKFDKDQDGQLNPQEYAALKHWGKKQMGKKNGVNPKMLEKYDTDKDGKLNKEERQALKADRKENKPDREPLTDEQKAERQAKQLAKVDTNKDGFVSQEELAAAAKEFRQERKERRQQGPKGKKGKKGKKCKKQQAEA
ncbi:MAG: hypothetical protein R3Y56_05755 [Akkermansia sp.]